ncbi:hypothetical protein BO71DRAFT_153441 [Aspergillus ellipticus CBS 707.79]|uniref:Uncharacterized protein n=1 Tax=Aspergillus ellipticus CBS 707.79 TaxID=1448320 RepID=A0A319EA65_9EURO|nr:hypothetical protein BO71DRAFT_153441 [Aspergillus ellipticus CBS 707.79]
MPRARKPRRGPHWCDGSDRAVFPNKYRDCLACRTFQRSDRTAKCYLALRRYIDWALALALALADAHAGRHPHPRPVGCGVDGLRRDHLPRDNGRRYSHKAEVSGCVGDGYRRDAA